MESLINFPFMKYRRLKSTQHSFTLGQNQRLKFELTPNRLLIVTNIILRWVGTQTYLFDNLIVDGQEMLFESTVAAAGMQTFQFYQSKAMLQAQRNSEGFPDCWLPLRQKIELDATNGVAAGALLWHMWGYDDLEAGRRKIGDELPPSFGSVAAGLR